MREPGHDREERDLEAHERDEQRQHPARLALGRDDQVGDQHPDHGEDHAVEHGVRQHPVGRGGHAGGVGDALEGGGPEQRRGAEGPPPRGVVDQVPHGDQGRADEAGDDAFTEVTGVGGHGRPSFAQPAGQTI